MSAAAHCVCVGCTGVVLVLKHEQFSQGVIEGLLPVFFDVIVRNNTTLAAHRRALRLVMVDICILEVVSVVLGFHTHCIP